MSRIPSKRPAEAQEAAWVADEDRFVLEQARNKAAIRVKGRRAQPIDLLTVALAAIDPERNQLDTEVEELEYIDPENVFDGLCDNQLAELEKGIDTYITLETSRSNREYWSMMKTICSDRRTDSSNARPSARGVGSIAVDLDKLLGPKNLQELEKLEKQIRSKLSSNEPIDTDYWEHLLRNLLTYKARARLRQVSRSVLDARLHTLQKQQVSNALALQSQFESTNHVSPNSQADHGLHTEVSNQSLSLIDPDSMLKLTAEDKHLDSSKLLDFTERVKEARENVSKGSFISTHKRLSSVVLLNGQEPSAKRRKLSAIEDLPPSLSAFDREVARGLGENEELFTQEVEVVTKNKNIWAQQHRPRKPKYFNRVQLGYEWNKYNQTHYDHENLPPRVVQGYKFNIFYPDLVDRIRAPTYRIERENGRKRGQLSAPAGEDDTCIIRFVAGAPYEDIAFRSVDKEWDYSAKRERGFRSSFDRGILQLHFQFKKIYYRK